MLIPVQNLVDRLRHPRSRADELAETRRRLRAYPGGGSEVSASEQARALELRRLKEELSAALAGVNACGSCARGYPLPNGYYDGGNCCGGDTASIFEDDELAALRLAGTAAADLRAPGGPHAGCAFRGPTGCTLALAHRPALCVRYVCTGLARELHARGDLARIESLRERLGAAYQAFAEARRARLLDEALRPPA